MDFKAMLIEERQRMRFANTSNVSQTLNNTEVLNVKVNKLVDYSETKTVYNFQLPRVDWEFVRVGQIPFMYYVPNFLTEDDECFLTESVDRAGIEDGVWQQLRTRKLQCWGGRPPLHLGDTAQADPLPPWLESLAESLVACGIFPPSGKPDHVLVNRYEADEGILHHTDGPTYLDRVAILSMQSATTMTFRPKLHPSEIGSVDAGDVCSLVLQPRSLLVFTGTAYDAFMHGIHNNAIDVVGSSAPCINADLAGVAVGDEVRRGLRTSLTLRRRRPA